MNRELLLQALRTALRNLDPRELWHAPVLLATWVASVVATVCAVRASVGLGATLFSAAWLWQLAGWLWLTVVFANFAEALAEGRGRARADALRQAQTGATARRRTGRGERDLEVVPAAALRAGDLIRIEAGEVIPADGEIVLGIAAVDESAVTGESAPVIRESGSDRSGVLGGTRVVSDWIEVRVARDAGQGYLDRLIKLVEGAKRQRTPNEQALSLVLSALTLVFVVVVAGFAVFARQAHLVIPLAVLAALFVALIPTTIGGLLSAIGIAGMDRLLQANVIAKSGRAVEAAGDVDVLLLDKTGTITYGNRLAHALLPLPGVTAARLAEAAGIASTGDDTPEGRSILALATVNPVTDAASVVVVPFTAQTRMSGADLGQAAYRKGATDAVLRWLREQGASVDEPAVRALVEPIARAGGTPLLLAAGGEALGVIHLKDTVKPGIRARFAELRALGIRTVMITGDNPLTAAAIAAEAGVDDVVAEATPEMKLARLRQEQQAGRLVAMCGDGANDAPALAQADVGLAMNEGTSAAKEAGNLVDLDSDPAKLVEVVQVGKQLLVSRGALTTFSVANDVAKYFAILPPLLALAYPQLASLDVMGLGSPQSAVLSAIIFNALVIIALVPLALRGARWRVESAQRALVRNLSIYGVGGLVAPFLGIKLVDLLVDALGWA